MSTLPQGYQVPKTSSHYLKFNQGDNLFRILAPAILGWEDWTEEKKPVRFPYDQKPQQPINPEKPIKHFWALPVWDYSAGAVKILEITQATIQEALFNLESDEAWGDLTGYDINIKKSGEKLETKYSIIAKPPKPLAPEIAKAFRDTVLDLNQLFEGGDPFNPEISPKNIPF